MGPSEYQGQAAQNQLGAGGQRLPSFAAIAPEAGTIAAAGAQLRNKPVPHGELTRIYEALNRFHSRICDSRERLNSFNDRAGVRHLPQEANTQPSAQPPQAEGVLPAIDAHLQLIHESLQQLDYQISRIEQL